MLEDTMQLNAKVPTTEPEWTSSQLSILLRDNRITRRKSLMDYRGWTNFVHFCVASQYSLMTITFRSMVYKGRALRRSLTHTSHQLNSILVRHRTETRNPSIGLRLNNRVCKFRKKVRKSDFPLFILSCVIATACPPCHLPYKLLKHTKSLIQ